MTEETTPTTETVEQPAPAAQEAAVQAEPFDKERAMSTIQKLREIEKQAKQDKKELEQLKAKEKERADAELSETEKLKKEADEAKARAAKLETDIIRRDVIAEVGLPAGLAERLKGSTKEEMLADAQELVKLLPKQPAPHVPATNPGGSNTAETFAERKQRLFGGNQSIFDPAAIKQAGGGVVWKDK